jgi:hypothetical protein
LRGGLGWFGYLTPTGNGDKLQAVVEELKQEEKVDWTQQQVVSPPL